MDYLNWLNTSYEWEKDTENSKLTRLQFLGTYIFEFSTIDDKTLALFTKQALIMCAAISNGEVYKLFEQQESYTWFFLIVNMTFFELKLYWTKDDTVVKWSKLPKTITAYASVFDEVEWDKFIRALMEFVNDED